MARVNEESYVLPATHTFIHVYGISHPVVTPQLQSITALWPVVISHPAEGRRLSWPEWLGETPRWFARPKTVTRSGTRGAAAGNRTHDYRIASPAR